MEVKSELALENAMPKNGLEKKSEDEERPNWSNGVEFLMSCVAVSIGLGNIWRFPFVAYENGGGAFLIPYIIVLFTIGKPLYFLEMILGQFTNQGSVKIWASCPSFVGVGYGQAFGILCVNTYYSSLLSLTLYYFAVSFQSVLPWSYCKPEWGSNCVDSLVKEGQERVQNSSVKLRSSSELYFVKEVIREKDDITDGIGLPNWHLTITLIISWIIIVLVIVRGIRSTGKVAYFLAVFPYVILITLLVRSVTLEGAVDGILFFLTPNWSELLNLNVWKEAVVQCCFSLTVGMGAIIMFSSYNRFDQNIYRDALIVTSLDTITSVLAGITIFGILGNLAHNLKITDISDVVKSGVGLAFITYPDAIAKFTFLPQLFAILFFLMLFVLGIGSAVALQNTIVTILCDQFKSWKYWQMALLSSFFTFCLSLVYVTPGGQWILNLVDFYAGMYIIFAMVIFETIGIGWIYGVQNLCDDVYFMLNRKLSLYWKICWGFVTPILLAVIFVYSLVLIQPLLYSEKPYPPGANGAGWFLFSFGFAQFPLWGLWYIFNHYEDNFIKSLLLSLKVNKKWGPRNADNMSRWLSYRQRLADERSKAKSNSKFEAFKQKCRNIFS